MLREYHFEEVRYVRRLELKEILPYPLQHDHLAIHSPYQEQKQVSFELDKLEYRLGLELPLKHPFVSHQDPFV